MIELGLWRPRASSSVALLLLGVLVAAATALAQGPLESGARMAPILIQGDDDLCDDEDGDGVVGMDDGIVNCDEADGSAERPFVVRGHHVRIGSETACRGVVVGGSCGVPHQCADTRPREEPDGTPLVRMGAVVICQTSKHIVLEDLRVAAGLRLVPAAADDACVSQCGVVTGGVLLLGASNVKLTNVHINTPGFLVHVGAATSASGVLWPSSGVTVSRIATGSSPAGVSGAFDPRIVRAIEVVDASVTVTDSFIDAAGRAVGVYADAQGAAARGTVARVVVERVTVQNASQHGIAVYGAELVVRDVSLMANGGYPTSAAVVEELAGGHIFLRGDTFLITDSEFAALLPGQFGVRIETSAAGDVVRNRFSSVADRMDAVWQAASYACNARVRFNDFNNMRVKNDEPTCFIDARRNWWGAPDGPLAFPAQADGRVRSDAPLAVPFAELPRLIVESPAAGAAAAGKVTVTGRAEVPAPGLVRRVEFTPVHPDAGFRDPELAEGAAEWRWVKDLSDHAPGPVTFWGRACTDHECGEPVPISLKVGRRPGPPVPVLTSSAVAVTPGARVLFDGSGSYSPSGARIVDYSFAVGTAPPVAGPDATFAYVFAAAGRFPVKLQVVDADGIKSPAPGTLTVVVVADGPVESAARPVPSVGVMTGLLAAVAATLWRRQAR